MYLPFIHTSPSFTVWIEMTLILWGKHFSNKMNNELYKTCNLTVIISVNVLYNTENVIHYLLIYYVIKWLLTNASLEGYAICLRSHIHASNVNVVFYKTQLYWSLWCDILQPIDAATLLLPYNYNHIKIINIGTITFEYRLVVDRKSILKGGV